MLVVAIGGKLSAPKRYTAGNAVVSTCTQDRDSDKSGDSQTYVSELSLTAVMISATSFDFSQPFVFLPYPVWSFVEKGVLVSINFDQPYHLLSYFNKIFGNQIAINAP